MDHRRYREKHRIRIIPLDFSGGKCDNKNKRKEVRQ